MQTDKVSVTLTSSDKYESPHNFEILAGNKELLIVIGKKVIARLTVRTMEKDVRDEDGDFHTKATENFYLIFEPEELNALDKNIASGIVLNEELSKLHQPAEVSKLLGSNQSLSVEIYRVLPPPEETKFLKTIGVMLGYTISIPEIIEAIGEVYGGGKYQIRVFNMSRDKCLAASLFEIAGKPKD